MKFKSLIPVVNKLLVCLAFAASAAEGFAAEITLSNSIVQLASAGTTNYTFTDPNSGANVVIAVTMTPYSSNDPLDVFVVLDGGTRLGVGNPNNGGDGNWIESTEGVDFSASLVSASSGIDASQVKFRIANIGTRAFATFTWTSSAGTISVNHGDGGDLLSAFDANAVSLATNYSATLRLNGQSQLTDAGDIAGKGIVFVATVPTISLTAGEQVGGVPSTSVPSLEFINPTNIIAAANFGGGNLVRDGISFTGMTGSSSQISNTIGGLNLVVSSQNGTVQSATFGDALFGSFLWSSSQSEMSVDINGLIPTNAYTIYYLCGDNRSLAFNMLVTLTGTNYTDTNTAVGTMSWGGASSNGYYGVYLPVTVSNVTFLSADMAKSAGSAGVAFSGVIVLQNGLVNQAPTLSSISTLSGASEDVPFTITYSNLLAASDAMDAEGPLSFRIESYNSSLLKNGTAVVPGTTLLESGESLVWLANSNENGTLPAFTVRAWDGAAASTGAVQVNVNVAAVNDPPVVENLLPAQSATYGTLFSYTIPGDTFSDIDSPGLTYDFVFNEGVRFPLWLSIDSNTGTLTGTPTNSGTYGGDAVGYDGVDGVTTPFLVVVSKAPLTVTADDAARAYGTANPVFTGSLSGLKNGDNITATFSCDATPASAPGTYTITATLNDPNNRLTNYVVTSITGTLTVTNVPVIISADPRTNSWMTSSAGQFVRLYTNAAAKTAGTTTTTWTFSSLGGTSVVGTQAAPVYAGVQEIYSSSNWVYIRSSTMPAMPIGPLLAYTPAPLYLPFNQKAMYRIPRFPTNTTSKTLTGGGAIGYLVDGVQMFDTRDALSWNGSSEGMGTGYWTRDAYVNEGYGFDPVQGHASPQGAYHYHSNPQGLRYMLGDHVDYDSVSRTYSESTAPVTKHSPILGWVRDGYPLYGPYGYSIASNSASGVRRMISGFVLRNGQNGTADLTTVGRTNIPPWAQRLYGVSNATGPSVASYGPLGRYLEDSDYLGDLTNPNTGSPFVKGVDFDLDEYNGRWCVTPEFPNGTYAYFVTINEDGSPKYPYYIGRAFFGSPTGNSVSTLSETVVTNFVGGTNMPLRLNSPTANGGTVTLTWSAVEGGTYKVETSSDLSSWNTATTNARPQQTIGAYTNVTADPHTFYRVTRTAVATFDPVNGSTGGTANGISSVSPTSGNRGTTFTLTINLNPAVNPPPQAAPVLSVTVGSITGTSNVHVSQTQVTSSITIPAGAATGPQTVTVTFPPPPGGSGDTIYTLSNGFTIQ